MNLVKRAKSSVLKQPVKSVILLLLVFILAAVMSGAISVTTAIRNTDYHLRRSLPPIVGFVEDWETRQEYDVIEGDVSVDSAFEPLTADIMDQITELPYVSRSYGFWTQQLYSPDMSLYIPEGASNLQDSHRCGYLLNGEKECYSSNRVFELSGTAENKPIEMQLGLVEFVAGRTFENYERYQTENIFPVMVSTVFAGTNGLSIGSTFSMLDIQQREIVWFEEWLQPDFEHTNHYYYFEVIGLFDIPEQLYIQEGFEFQVANSKRVSLNRIYTPMSVIEEIASVINEMEIAAWGSEPWFTEERSFNGIVVLNDPLDLEAFHSAAIDLLPRFWYMDDLTDSFGDFSNSMVMLLEIADWILWATIGATVIVLVLLITLFLHDRRHEIGIYLALGEKRGRIILQLVSETVAVAFIGITFALFVGNIISNELSQDMLRTEITRMESERREATHEFAQWSITHSVIVAGLDNLNFIQPLSPDEALEIFDTSLSTETILLLYVIGLGTTGVATGISVLYVVKMNPKKILM